MNLTATARGNRSRRVKKDYLRLVGLALIALAILLIATAAQAAPLTLTWPDQPAGSPPVDGYRIYRVVKETPTPEGPEIITYQQVNSERIDETKRQYTIADAPTGSTYTIRAFNVGGEGPDSPHFTMPAPPAQVPGLDALKLLVEVSRDLVGWDTYAVLTLDRKEPGEFFRLNW